MKKCFPFKSDYEEVGYEFNINSPKQLGVALLKSWDFQQRKRQRAATAPTPMFWRI